MRAQLNTENGPVISDLTSMVMAGPGGSLDTCKAAVVPGTTLTNGSFVIDISSYGFTEAPFPIGNVFSSVGVLNVANLVGNDYSIKFTSVSTTEVKGYITKLNTILLGGLSVALLTAPVNFQLFLVGK